MIFSATMTLSTDHTATIRDYYSPHHPRPAKAQKVSRERRAKRSSSPNATLTWAFAAKCKSVAIVVNGAKTTVKFRIILINFQSLTNEQITEHREDFFSIEVCLLI